MAERLPNFRLTIKKCVEGKFNKAFLHLVPNFWHYVLIFQGGERQKVVVPGTFQNYQKCQKIVQ